MCLTFFVANPSKKKSEVKFLIAFNREQQTKRETLAFGPFSDDPDIMAGRDIISTGTWLGFNIKTGLLVFLTNYDVVQLRRGLSRGKLLKRLLSTESFKNIPPQKVDELVYDILDEVLSKRKEYTPCNVVVYNARSQKLLYICTELCDEKMPKPRLLEMSTAYGMCNTDIDTIWPKTGYGLEIFRSTLSRIDDLEIGQVVGELQRLMKDKKQFSKNDQDQSAIFVEPYYCIAEKAQRMTKSTFIAIFIQNKQTKKIELQFKELSYLDSTKEETVQSTAHIVL